MDKLRLLLTACGAPGGATLIRMLKNNGERDLEIIGTDVDSQPIGRFLCDNFYQVPAGNHSDFIPALLDIVEKEKPDVLLPESSNEVYRIASSKDKLEKAGTKVLVSSPEAIELAANKYEMYQSLRGMIELPSYRLVSSLDDFIKAVYDLGYPERAVIFKPPVSKGSRGFRIIDSTVDRKTQLLYEKPTAKYMSLEEFRGLFSASDEFPELLVMEFLEGEPYDINTIAMDGRELLTDVKTREQERWGIITKGELVQREDLVEQVRKILGRIKLSYCANIQFIGDKLIEINPRVSTFMYQKDLIMPYIAIKLAQGEISQEEIIKMKDKFDYGRMMVRYMDQVFFHKEELI